jgi:hypothetical protein
MARAFPKRRVERSTLPRWAIVETEVLAIESYLSEMQPLFCFAS